jgi:hypothetical protein
MPIARVFHLIEAREGTRVERDDRFWRPIFLKSYIFWSPILIFNFLKFF